MRGSLKGRKQKKMSNEQMKCVIVVDSDLPPGIVANTAAILGATLGKNRPEIVGHDVTDASCCTHMGVVTVPVPILKSDGESLGALRRKLYEEHGDIMVADFSDIAQGCKTYEEYLGKVSSTAESEHRYLGIALFGDRKTVNKLTGSMPLLR